MIASSTSKRWKDGLDHLQCPYTRDYSDEEVIDLLLNESEERLGILEWLLLLYQPRLIEILEPTNRAGGRIFKSKIERILKAVNTLCLCHAEDFDLIKGAAPVNKQRLLINRLIDLAVSKESDQIISPRETSTYIDRLADQGLCLSFDNKIDLIPKDLKAELNSSYLGLEGLRATQQECDKEVEKLQEEIDQLQKKISIQTPTQQKEVSAMNQMLSSSIQDLDQLASGFLHSYESHIGAWCQGAEPDLNDLGPSAKRVHTKLKKFMPFLEDINKLRQLRCDLEDNIKEHHIRKAVEAISINSSTSDNIQHCLGILEESIHRIDSGFKSRYQPLLQL